MIRNRVLQIFTLSRPSNRYVKAFEASMLLTLIKQFLKGRNKLQNPKTGSEADILFNQAFTHYQVDKLNDAQKLARHAVELNPDHGEAWHLLGVCLLSLNHAEQAYTALGQASRFKPYDVMTWLDLARAAKQLGKTDEMIDCYRRTLAIEPHQPDIWNNLGITLLDKKHFKEALVCCREAVARNPTAITYNNLGAVLLRMGRPDEAIDIFGRATELNPDMIDAYRGLFVTAMYLPWVGDTLERKLLNFGAQVAEKIIPLDEAWTMTIDSERSLRIGYVSSDFRRHPVSYNMLPILAQHDHARHEVYLYADIERPDEVTELAKKRASVWRDIRGMSDEAAARLIRQDQIDILVVLAWRFDRNRPLIAAYRAAPVQVSYHDPGTSGIAAMDYLITDTVLTPKHCTESFSEQLVRLPTYYLHEPVESAPHPGPPPSLQVGHLTFGCFNNAAKIGPTIIGIWSQVLKAVPNSRLFLKYNNYYAEPENRQRYIDWFALEGVESERLEFHTTTDLRDAHLRHYAKVDIALDTFPFTGSTTTFESLWMGVPVVTLAGKKMISRWSASMLTRVGLADLVAESVQEYVRIAADLAKDTDRLQRLRAELRDNVRISPLCDSRRRTRHLERAYRYMWRKWCASSR